MDSTTMVIWMLVTSGVSAFPAAIVAFYLGLRFGMKTYIKDLSKLLDSPDMVYSLKSAADKWAAARADENAKQTAANAAVLTAAVSADIDAKLNVKIQQLGQQLSDQQTQQAEQMFNELRGLMGAFTKSFVQQLNGDGGGRGGPLGKLGAVVSKLDEMSPLLEQLRGRGGAGAMPMPSAPMQPYR